MTRCDPSSRRLPGRLAVGLAVLLLAGCGGSSGGNDERCGVVEQNEFVYRTMQDLYLWSADVPVVDPAAFGSPQALLDAVRAPQDRFSFIRTRAEDDALLGDGQFVGIGVRTDQPGPEELRVVEIFEGGPADRAGLDRGDRILSVNGRPIAEVLADEGFSAALGPREVGVEVGLTWRKPSGAERAATVTKAVVTIPPVARVDVLDTAAGPVGYLVFRTFVETAAGPLEDAFATFKSAGVGQVVIDLRYNSGGLLSIAQLLADLAGGAGAAGQPIYTLEYNAANSARNRTAFFRERASSLNPARLIFITTGTTASASEMVINALEPFYDVVLVGERTFGKPVGQDASTFCDQVLRAVTFRTVNALGVGDYFDGLPVDCPAVDDLDAPLGDPAEASLAEALQVAVNGACSGPATAVAPVRAKPDRQGRPWRQLDAD
jgi:C-terminal peptidase prc